jgi:hypothetical protein
MQIDEKDEHEENAWYSIRESLDSDSNRTVESERQPAKQSCPSDSTDDGMQCAKALILARIEPSKVNGSRRSSIGKGFGRLMECKLTKASNTPEMPARKSTKGWIPVRR